MQARNKKKDKKYDLKYSGKQIVCNPPPLQSFLVLFLSDLVYKILII